jgi:MFS family permease
MQNGTTSSLSSNNQDNQNNPNCNHNIDDSNDYSKYRFTLILLCLGYFIDFYDLTIFSASYATLIKDLFHITDIIQIQTTYLLITNYHTAGIVLGGILFGVLGDKFGRISMIRYSILLYSVSTILCIFASSVKMFIVLRFLAGVGLAAEFATSCVLISELLPAKLSSRYTAILYFCGILGGITATYLSGISWQIMFFCGGAAGLILYVLRKKMFESVVFLNLAHNAHNVRKGDLLQLFNSYGSIIKFIKLFILIVPFNFLISTMLIYPRFMPLTSTLASSVRILLMGFFIGNLISTLNCNWIVNKFKDFRVFLLINIIIFAMVMPFFWLINDGLFFGYCLILGLLGGGLPTVWIQFVAKSYGTNLRSTAAATLYACGRLSSIVFNVLAGLWLINPQMFIYYCGISTVVISVLVLVTLIKTKNNYAVNMNFLE